MTIVKASQKRNGLIFSAEYLAVINIVDWGRSPVFLQCNFVIKTDDYGEM